MNNILGIPMRLTSDSYRVDETYVKIKGKAGKERTYYRRKLEI
jgi:transposase-like protein